MITCDQHDYIEIACTFRYPVKLTMKTGVVIEGIALDTQIITDDQHKIEIIKIDTQGDISSVALDDISVLEISIDNPHFRSIAFS